MQVHSDSQHEGSTKSDLLPVEDIAMFFGQGSEGGSHLAALCWAVPWQVVCIIVAQAQEALQPGTAVIRASTVVAMG